MAETKTKPTEISARDYISALPDEKKRADAETLLALFERVTGEPATMWGPSMIGFGSYDYVYDSGHKGTAMRGGFSPRKANLVLYLMGTYGDGGVEHSPLLANLGKHKTAKSCLYVNKLADVDLGVLREIAEASVADTRARYPAC